MIVVFSVWFYCLSLADYIKSNDADNDDQGHKWSLRHVTRNSSSRIKMISLHTKRKILDSFIKICVLSFNMSKEITYPLLSFNSLK
jgi:hypothetical protein